MNQFFTARFNNGYSVEVYTHNDQKSSNYLHLVPCGLDGKPHSIVSECEVKPTQLAMTLDYLQFQMNAADDPKTQQEPDLAWILSEELVDALLK